MRKSFALVILAAFLCLSGCESVSRVPVNMGTESVSKTVKLMIEELESSNEPVAPIESSVDIDEPVAEETEEKARPATTHDVEPENEDAEDAKAEDRSPEEETTSPFEPVITKTSAEATEESQSEPKTPVNPPKETEQPAPPETTMPEVTELPVETQPKTAYDYEFDINAIRADCIAIGQGMGYTLNTCSFLEDLLPWSEKLPAGICKA